MMGKTGVSVSALGYGCMRYPRKGPRIDAERTRRQLLTAMDAGVNYFDTAYAYMGGQSEAILGEVLSRCRREASYIADKIPSFIVFSRKDMDRFLKTMLARLRTDWIDFLLAHALNDSPAWERLKNLGYREFLEKAKKEEKIRFAGFSWHGNTAEFKKVVDDYPWDFCQIQYNYLDENNQAGREGLEYAAGKGLGVVVMEPLRGGSLVGRMPAEVAAVMESAPFRKSPAGWALDWVWDHPGVSTVLSGLNVEAHIVEDVALAEASAVGKLTPEEKEVLGRVRDTFRTLMRVGCTGCAYCMPCPFGVEIPYAFASYNTLHLFHDRHVRFQYTLNTSGMTGGHPSGASQCRVCGKCEERCPQHIAIREELKHADHELTVRAMQPVAAVLRFLLGRRRGRAKR